jgi:flagellar basal body-associated protein FliL
MADEKNDVENKEDTDSEQQKTAEKKTRGGLIAWIIMAVVVVVCAGAGLGIGRFLAGFGKTNANESSQQAEPTDAQVTTQDIAPNDPQQTWYHDFEPVVANLNEPGVTRYVRATLTLEISGEVGQKEGTALIKENNPIMKNWLTLHLASLALDDIRGGKNLKRIQSQMLEAFNEKLFPDAKPQIKRVLFKEFAIQ